MSRRIFYFMLASVLFFGFLIVSELHAAPLTGAERKKEFARKMNVLGNIGFGVRSFRARGANGEEMVRDLARVNAALNAEGDFLVNATSKDFRFDDMWTWGTTDLASAQELFASGDGSEEDEIKQKRRGTIGRKILGELLRLGGTSFGFTSGSSSYCGVSFMGLLVVDEENSTIYELSLTASGPC